MAKELAVLIVVLVCVGFGFFAIPQKAQITFPITVRNTSDIVVRDACAEGSSTPDCSLRGAIQAANENGSLSRITFAIPASDPFCSAGVCTINLTSALPDITEPVSITGPGADKLIVKPATGVNVRVFNITSSGTVTLSDLTISNGSPSFGGGGGGILKSGTGTLTLNNLVISNNGVTGGGNGGGISNSGGILNIINTTVSGNFGATNGGGLSAGGTVNITNSTFHGNNGGTGGGIVFASGTLNVTNSTIAGNNAPGGNGGGISNFFGTAIINVKSSIIALNTSAISGPDVNSNFVSAGFNLIGKRDGSTGFTAPTDLTGTIAAPLNPMLDPAGLQNNGGLTKTIRLLAGSPAIDKATSNGLTGNLTTDQRGTGFPRTFDNPLIPNAAGGNGTDIGAFERGSRTPFDFDGDGKTDVSVFRPSVGEWFYQQSSNAVTRGFGFGTSTDKPVPADYTGDGKTDIAFFRPSTGNWFVLRSEDSTFFAFPFGNSTDKPAPADYDGDGKTDPTVYRPSVATWFILRSSDGGVSSVPFGISSDVPEPADYDGDGKADVGIYRPGPGQWWNLRSSNGSVFAATFGSSTDKPVPGDYTGDGKADVAFYRPSEGTWYVLRSEDQTFFAFPFGNSTDKPAPADFDGDGRYDAAIFRPSDTNWYILRSTGGVTIQQFGAANDVPLPGAFVP